MKGFLFKFKANRIKTDKTYNSKLIDELHKEHVQLFSLYEQIMKFYKEQNYKKALKTLKKFYQAYHLHILKEDKQLYNYLVVKYKFFPETRQQILEKQQEMQEITEAIENFANRYNNIDEIKKSSFLEEFQILGEILTKRIEFEENELYEKY